MTPLFVQQGILIVLIAALLVTIVVNLISSGKRWGSLKAVVVQHGEAIDDIRGVLSKEDGTHNFVTKDEFDDHTKRCPQLICAKINDVKSLVQITAEKLDSTRFLGVRLDEGMKMLTQAIGQQQDLVKQLDKSVSDIKLQVAVLKGQWDGRERRNPSRADT